jgi:hypothetical protein
MDGRTDVCTPRSAADDLAARIAAAADGPLAASVGTIGAPLHRLVAETQASPERHGAGWLAFRTIRPRGDALPDVGPVGRLPAALGLPLERSAHLHVRVTVPGIGP